MGRDLREFRRRLDLRLLLAFILLLFLVGDGLIWVLYGGQAAIIGALCMGAGTFLLGLLWAMMSLLEWISNKDDPPA